MRTWSDLIRFAQRFRLDELAGCSQVRDWFGLYSDYVDALIQMLDQFRLPAVTAKMDECDAKALRRLESVAQDMAEVLILAVTGMYSSSAAVFRCAVEGIFKLLVEEAELAEGRVLSEGRSVPVRNGRPARRLPSNRTPMPGEILEWLDLGKSSFQPAAERLQRTYHSLSSWIHRDGKPTHLANYLMSLPRRDILDCAATEGAREQSREAERLQNHMERACVFGSMIVKDRFRDAWDDPAVFEGARTAFNESVVRMARSRDQADPQSRLEDLWEQHRKGMPLELTGQMN